MKLPEIEFCEKDPRQVEAKVLTTYEGLTDTTLAPGDPVRLFLESLAAVIIQQRVLIDLTGKRNLVEYADGDYLDHLGVQVDTPRLDSSPARVPMRFSLANALGFAVTVPKGTRVTPDRKIYFSTEETVDIPAGSLFIDVWAECQTVGEAGNGFLAGQVNKLVDPLDYAVAVVNTAESGSGAEVEKDPRYKERIKEAPRSFSVAGPDGAYQYWAKTAHQNIVSVSVRMPSAGIVEVRPLLVGGEIPGQELLDLVEEILTDRKVRPLTDQVNVAAPEVVEYALTMDYWVGRENAAVLGQIQTAVDQAVTDYVAWQCEKLGRDINPDELVARVKNAGAKRVAVSSPVLKVLSVYQVAKSSAVTVNYKGLEDG